MTAFFRATIAIGVSFLIAYSGFLLWSFHYGVAADRIRFAPAEWKQKANVYAHSNDPGCVRGGMALDIIATNLLQGKLIAEVKPLLGEPDGSKGAGIYYELGQCSGLGFHNSVLQIDFNSNQQVASAIILRH